MRGDLAIHAISGVFHTLGADIEEAITDLFLRGHSTALGDAIMSNLAEVTINYRTSPIVEDHRRQRSAAVHPGDHLTEVDGLTHTDGATAYPGDLLQQPGHVILLSGKDRATASIFGRGP